MPCAVDPRIVHNFSVLYMSTVAVIYAIGFVIIAYFPISRESHRENLRKLAGEAGQLLADEPPAPIV